MDFMDAATALRDLMSAIDEHRWSDLEMYLHPDFTCLFVHSGESFSREQWIKFNAEYPGFDRLRVEELVGGANEAACRSHVTSKDGGGIQQFGCASFARMSDGLILRLTEIWTGVDQTHPPGTRPELESPARS